MDGSVFFFLDFAVVAAAIIWAVYELWSMRRSKRRDAAVSADRARHAEGEQAPHQG